MPHVVTAATGADEAGDADAVAVVAVADAAVGPLGLGPRPASISDEASVDCNTKRVAT